jgi:hypothetical protein
MTLSVTSIHAQSGNCAKTTPTSNLWMTDICRAPAGPSTPKYSIAGANVTARWPSFDAPGDDLRHALWFTTPEPSGPLPPPSSGPFSIGNPDASSTGVRLLVKPASIYRALRKRIQLFSAR